MRSLLSSRSVTRLICAIIVAVVAIGAIGCDDEDADIAANHAILDELPVYPDAERAEVTDNAYYGDSGPRLGYTTNVIYEPPDGTTDRDVIDFYRDSMPNGWDGSVDEVPIVEAGSGEQRGVILIAQFTRGDASVSVNTDNMMEGGPQTFEVAINHKGARQPD